VKELFQTFVNARDQERQRLIRLLEEKLGGSLNLLLAQTTAFRTAYARSAAPARAFDTLIGLAYPTAPSSFISATCWASSALRRALKPPCLPCSVVLYERNPVQ
jgi:hypothetical protein